ncbi:MAG: isoprenylcysteine carboxylmethyltransferase family protein [Oscillospiraceae bacterium]|nr:isoprenylcysteine carboxylmethyltransferase family protein [Oscillospiraceae bacterium]
MDMQKTLSVILFALLVVMVLARAVKLRKRGVRVIVFGQTDKNDFLLVPFVLAIVYTALAGAFGFPIWRVLTQPFWSNAVPGWVGLVLCLAAVIGVALTLVGFGDSFRVGIDESKPDKLVTNGMFAISRNPIYVCFLMFCAGLFLVHRNVAITVADVLFALVIHRQVMREEKFLATHYGAEYEEYRKKVRRYL